MPVVLQFNQEQENIKFPFKLNLVWLIEPNFVNLVRSNQHKLVTLEYSFPMDSLVLKLKLMKSLVIKWERNKKQKYKEELVQLDVDLENIYSALPGSFERDTDRVFVLEKERRKLKLLKQEEETWRKKGRVSQLVSGDRNTKFFHSFANFRRHNNSIWDIKKEHGSLATSQKELEEEVVYFQNNFKTQENLSIVHQLEVIQAYPRLFSLEE